MKSKILKFLFNRLTVTVYVVALEILLTTAMYVFVREKLAAIEIIMRILSAALVLYIIRTSEHISFDLFWLIIIVLFPVPGTVASLLLDIGTHSSKTYKKIVNETQKASKYYLQDENILKDAEEKFELYRGQIRYLSENAGFPVYENKKVNYYPSGEDGYETLLDELRKAEKFIFLEYFIIEEGKMWDEILEILKEKVASGVEVRVMYDDFGSFYTFSAHYRKKISKLGIKCSSFNQVNPVINGIMNHRDHRKILVVDGKVAFSGGINIADEYINEEKRYGYWKDNLIRIEGSAVWSLTVMFLSNWNALNNEDSDYSVFKADTEHYPADGFIVPYCDSPLDGEIVGQNVYINILSQARDYVYIMTPYLIIDHELSNCLKLAVKRGVDVRLIVPGVPDKKIVYEATKSSYRSLIKGGVKIYEYVPGFVHSKVFVCDDTVATVGTINLDYRSLYLHFENGIYLYGCGAVLDVKRDVVNTLEECRKIELSDCREGLARGIFRSILKIIAPMM